jgi:hypothetical protein
MFKNAKITIYEIYPDNFYSDADIANNILDNAPAGLFWSAAVSPVNEQFDAPFYYVVYNNTPAKVTQKIPARIPINLYNPLTNTMKLGIIEVVRYY